MRKRYSRILYVAIALLIGWAVYASCHIGGTKHTVFVLHPFSADNQSFGKLTYALQEELAGDDYDLHFAYVNLNPTLCDDSLCVDEARVQAQLDSLAATGVKPDMFLLYGDRITHAAAALRSPSLARVPVVYMAVTYPEFQQRIAKRTNFTGYKMHMDFKKNLDFIADTYGKGWVEALMDSNYLDDHYRQLLVQQLGGDTVHYRLNMQLDRPSTYVPRARRDTTRTTFFPFSLQVPDRNYRYWQTGQGFDIYKMLNCEDEAITFLRTKNDEWSNQALNFLLGYYFSMTPERFNLPVEGLVYCMGGYMTPLHVMAEEVHQLMEQIEAGAAPSQLGMRTHQADYWINWKVARNIFSFADELPSYVHFLNLPWYERSLFLYWIYIYGIPLLVLLLVLLAAIFQLAAMYRKHKYDRLLRKRSEEDSHVVQTIVDTLSALNAFVFTLNADGSIKFGERFYRKFHMRERSVPQRTFLRCLSSADAIQVKHAFDHADEEGEELILDTLPILTGKRHAIRLRISNVVVNGRRLTVGLFYLIDHIRENENRMREALRMDEEAKIKAGFLASMGHEIRNPLNSIVGYSNLLLQMRETMSDEELAMISKTINDCNKQLLTLLDNVVTYSPDSEEKLTLPLSKKSVSILMEEFYAMYAVSVPETLRFELVKGDEADHMMVNRSSMMQIVGNLINNAVKFTGEGSITLGWHSDEEHVYIYVEDTGIGIAPENLDKIFVKYHKVSSAMAGAGIGLSLCERLTEAMQGHIVVESELDKGSRFTVILPKA